MIVVTAATGSLGRLVVAGLLRSVPAGEIAVAVRNPDKAADFAARGVAVRTADYGDAASMRAALTGADAVLMISASDPGNRLAQQLTAVEAAKQAGVGRIAYTSILRADTSTMLLAGDHLATERAIAASGLQFTFLRNGWYHENYLPSIGQAAQTGSFAGAAAPDAVLNSATRADYADAAVAVLTGTGHEGQVYELAGDDAWSYGDLAREVGAVAGKPVEYQQFAGEKYEEILTGAGVPEVFAHILADSDQGISRGELADGTGTLHALIGRATTPITQTVAEALKG